MAYLRPTTVNGDLSVFGSITTNGYSLIRDVLLDKRNMIFTFSDESTLTLSIPGVDYIGGSGINVTGSKISAIEASQYIPGIISIQDQTFSGNKTFLGNISVANLTVTGTTTTVDSTTLQISDKVIEVGKGNTAALTTMAGLVVPKYDGEHAGGILFDANGTVYVGDLNDNYAEGDSITISDNPDLVPLAARTGIWVNGRLAKWQSSTNSLVDSGSIIGAGTTIGSNLTIASSVPSVAYFTDTLYNAGSGLTLSSTADPRTSAFSLNTASPTSFGGVTTTDQIFAGNKTFNDSVKVGGSSGCGLVYNSSTDSLDFVF